MLWKPAVNADPLVLVLMGVSGSRQVDGRGALHERLGWDFGEGDDLHPPDNVAKMAAGEPLTDADRAPWLDRIAAWIEARRAAGRSAIVTCSALRRGYRDRMRYDDVLFVWLDAPHEVLAARIGARRGHYMPAALLDSQLAALEPPAPDERAVRVDVTRPLAEQVDVLTALTG